MNVDVSFILPCYNVADKMAGCLSSLDELRTLFDSFEVIFVDDMSTDDSLEKIAAWVNIRDWAQVVQLEQNSGTPSKPRNHGLAIAQGEFVYFLDPDDELIPAGFIASLNLGKDKKADIVRSPLVRVNGTEKSVVNRIPQWSNDFSREDRVKAIFSSQSTNPPALIRKSILNDSDLRWPEDLRMGEDSVFLARVLMASEVIEYNDEADFNYNVEVVSGTVSSTQQYNDRELYNHLEVWSRVSSILEGAQIDYFEIRGQVALQACFQSMIRFNEKGFSQEAFTAFHELLSRHKEVVGRYSFGTRLSEIRDFVLSGDYPQFLESIKARLLIAGFDLKFIRPVLPSLERLYRIRVDEWTGHDSHNIEQSRKLLQWADIIHCEWLLGNAVWYSKHKRMDQTLIIRAHRFEQTRDFGFQLDISNVNRIIAVSLPTLEDFLSKFKLPREKMRLIPNYVDVNRYAHSTDPNRVFNLAMIGSVPSLKGYKRAIVLLDLLRRVDDRFNLTIFGKSADELPWVKNDPAEKAYFDECEKLISTLGLAEYISHAGWVDTQEALAEKGIVLSLSDLESFHVAPAEAFAAGNIAFLLNWPGVEYIYPSDYICETLLEMRDRILESRDECEFDKLSKVGSAFVSERYSVERFVSLYRSMLQGV